MTEIEWQALQAQWVKSGLAVECTNSQTLADIKGEIEKLCSKAPCHYPQTKTALSGIKKILKTGQQVQSMVVY